MDIRILNLDDKKYEFSLSELSKIEWQMFLESVILDYAGPRAIHTAMASVSVRDNNAKVKLAYVSENYHEMCIRLDEFGSKHDRDSLISRDWQFVMAEHFGHSYAEALAESVDENQANC